MRRNGYLWTSGINLNTTVRFADPDFLLECKISAIWRRFPLIIAFYILNVRHISTSGLFDLLICAESRDPWVGGGKRLHFWNPRPRFAYSLYNFGGSTMNIIKVICENNARPVLKDIWDSTPTLIIPTKFEVDMTIHCRVTAFLSADRSRDLVTLTFDLLTLNSCHTWGSRDQPCHQVWRPYDYSFMSYEL